MCKNIKIVLIMLFLISFLACKNDNPATPTVEYEPEVVVFGLLLMTERDQSQQKTIRLEQSYNVTDYLPEYPQGRAITDAQVYVETKETRVQFEYEFDSIYSDKKKLLDLVPGELYKLDITLQDGRKITSECIMPDRPTILQPNFREPVKAYEPLTVAWEKAEFAFRYQIAIDDDYGGFQFSTFSASDEEELYSFLFAKPNNYTLKVASLDENYYDYLRSRSNRDPILHINGALGVFGAIAYDRERFSALAQ